MVAAWAKARQAKHTETMAMMTNMMIKWEKGMETRIVLRQTIRSTSSSDQAMVRSNDRA